MKSTCLLLFAIFLVVVSSLPSSDPDKWVKVDFTKCHDNDPCKIDTVEILNYPLMTSATSMSVHTSGSCPFVVKQGARADIKAYLGNMKVFDMSLDACEQVAKSNPKKRCPLDANDIIDMITTTDIPKTVPIPPGVGIRVEANAVNYDGTTIFCVRTVIKFKGTSS